jgi:amino acid transporter
MVAGGVSEESPLIGGNGQHRNETDDHLHRHLGLFDLVCIGVGATVGSGVFVLIGLIAHTCAGPAVFLSWGIAGK